MTREPLYAALFAFFSGLSGTVAEGKLFRTATRKLTTWDAAQPEDQPMLLMQQKRETANYRRGLPTIWTLDIALFVYVHTGANNDQTLIPSQILNPLLDALEASLEVDDLSNNACTLGGLVSHCAISGAVEIFQGDLGDQEVAIVPIQILVSP